MSSVRRKIITNVLYLTSGQLLSWGLAAVDVLIIPRYLGPSLLGVFTFVGAISGIVGVIAALGTKVFILREVARDPVFARKLVGPAILMYIVLGIVCWLVAAVSINFIDSNDIVVPVLYLMAITNIIGLSVAPLQSALQGMDKMHFSFVEALLFKGIGTFVRISIVILNLGLVALAASGIFTAIPILIFYWWAFTRHSSTKLSLEPGLYLTLIKGGLAFLMLDIGYNIYLYLDSLLLSVLTNETIVGYYGVPMRLLGSLLFMPVIIGQAILPSLSRFSINSDETSNSISTKTVNFLLCISIPLAVGTTVMAEPFISFFYGSEFSPSIPILIILGWTAVPMYLGIGLYQNFVAKNKQGYWAKLMIMACFVNLILNLLLIPFFQSTAGNGGIGAGFGLLITESIIGYFGIKASKGTIVNKGSFIIVLKSLLAAVLMGILIWPLGKTWLPIPVIVGVIIYGISTIPLFNLWPLLQHYISKARFEFARSTK